MKIIIKELPENEYYNQSCIKSQIVLHHTVGTTVQGAIDWWKSDKGEDKIATAYIIDKNGDIYNLFDDKSWAWHIGKGSSRTNNKTSIGIEIVNEGALTMKDKKFYWLDGKVEYKGSVVISDPWRGYTAFAEYIQAQKDSVTELVKHLCKKHSIPTDVIQDYIHKDEYFNFKGIVSHHNLRPDKTDVSIAFNLAELHAKINGV